MPYWLAMHTVGQTASFIRSAEMAGMSAAERDAVAAEIGLNPTKGDLIVGSGGLRKVRVAGRGKGKSGGFRVFTFYGGPDIPVYLLWALSKGRADNLSDAQVQVLAKLAKSIAESRRQPAT